jgi:hypothetical protein
MDDPKQKVFLSFDLAMAQTWIRERRQEDLHLDFKTLGGDNDFDRDDRKNLAKAVSGFSNSDGGLIVWGIEASKDKDGVDAAKAESFIPQLRAAYSKLQSITGDTVSPIVTGIDHRSISAVGDTGLIITYVPASDTGPHMAGFGENRYYKRSGDSFYQMAHFDIADMFGRRRRPALKLKHELQLGSIYGNKTFDIIIRLSLENNGRALARFPFLSLLAPPEIAISTNVQHGYRLVSYNPSIGQYITFAGDNGVAIHPGTSQMVAWGSMQVTQGTPIRPSFQVAYRMASEDFPLVQELLTITESEIKSVLPPETIIAPISF